MYIYKDYTDFYGRVMQFGKNKKVPIHRWYPFVEGYSREFIESIILEQKKIPENCLEPFSGSGTTALELQNMGIKCFSFEVNPFMYTLSKAKLKSHDYKSSTITKHLLKMKVHINDIDDYSISDETVFPTLIENEDKKKWNLNKPVYIAIEKILSSIKSLNSVKYADLYTIVVANALLKFSNLYRNGKCLSYKKDWQKKYHTQEDVIKYFFDFIKDIVLNDIKNHQKVSVHNNSYVYNGDSRKLINNKIEDNSIDLVITSPPYLNSRDYTDSYMLELKALNYLKNFEDVKNLRNQTLRSHVQLKLNNDYTLKNEILDKTILELTEASKNFKSWNKNILLMVRAYFEDIEDIFRVLYAKIKEGKKVYFNVSNSAYFGVMIDTLEICSLIAENLGFEVLEIREARYLKSSPQQKNIVENLLEGVIVLKK